MRRGRPKKPTISVESVEATLKSLGHHASEVPETVALQHLALVDLYLENPSRPPTEDLRGWALRSLLVEIITESLSEQRHFFDLAPASPRENRRTALERIQQDSLQNSSVLLGWSILFYRYVRSDLAIAVQEFADCINIHPRTFRREHQSAILRLRDKLADAEWKARQINQHRMLRATIPEKAIKLIERDNELNLALNTLQEDRTPHFFVTGAAGIGKSAFAATIAYQLIDDMALDYLVWLSKPQRSADVKNAVQDTLLPYPSQAKLNTLLLEYRTLIVIDDVEALIISHEEWLDLLSYLTHAIVIICNREHVLFPNPVIHIPIQELSEFGIYELIGTYHSEYLIGEKLQNQIWEKVGGNPRGVDYAIRQIRNGNVIQFGNSVLHTLYDDLFEQLDNHYRALWILLATIPNGIYQDSLKFMIDSDSRFFDYGLLELLGENEVVRLVSSAKYYIKLLTKTNEELTSLANTFIQTLLEGEAFLQKNVSDAFLEILDCSWLKIEDKTVLSVLLSCDTHILTKPQLRKWWHSVSRIKSNSFELLLLKGIAARRLHYYEEAFEVLGQLIKQTGQVGNFIQQSAARYELAVLYQSRSEFDAAIRIYQELETYLSRMPNPYLLEQINRQQARIAIEKRHAQNALHYLKNYSHAIQDGILFCEALLLQGKMDLCRSSAKKYLTDVQDEPILMSSLYTIIGRSYVQANKMQEALDYFKAALTLTERFGTDFDIARTQCNLASIYMQLENKKSLGEAEDLLKQAHSTQSLIADAVGLIITERNLQYLRRLHLSK